jgi:uncharacterized protein (UPF0276 family)
LGEHDFYAGVVERAGCGYLLDVNNIYVSSQNHGFSPHEYLARIDASRVLQVHVAGHSRLPDGTLVDTHDQQVIAAVWDLYRATFRSRAMPTLLEWDDHIPPLDTAVAELQRAKQVRA